MLLTTTAGLKQHPLMVHPSTCSLQAILLLLFADELLPAKFGDAVYFQANVPKRSLAADNVRATEA